MSKLPIEYYLHNNVVELASSLIGKVLCTRVNGKITKGVIRETEAYNGIHDKACHAYGGRRTKRTAVMFESGGHAYVYLCYGIHHLFNIVTGAQDEPTAILIRGIEPLEGIQTILQRRNKPSTENIASGPGTLSEALGIRTDHSGVSLTGDTIWLEDHGIAVSLDEIQSGPRIGVSYAGEDALLPYRFVWKGEMN